MEKFHVWMIGCQYNEHDAIRVSHMLKKLGFSESSAEEADFIIILACSVRQTAIDRIFGKLKHWPDKRVIITACVLPADRKRFAQRGVLFWDIQKPKELAKILGIEDLREIKKFMNEGRNLSCYVPIMIGCNNFCSYCAVPLTRGRETSVPFDAVVKQVENLVARGVKNITLLGQNVNSYGSDFIQKMQPSTKPVYVKHLGRMRIPTFFPHLLEKIARMGFELVDFMSSNPWDFSDELIDVIAQNKNITRTIHLPVQSGDDDVLKRMNRWYTADQYIALISKLKRQISNVSVTTDIIVGFCKETDEEFNNTVKLVKSVDFKKAYVAIYSKRPFTVATKTMKDDVPYAVKKKRWELLEDLIFRSKHT